MRHGRTVWNAERRLSGRSEVPLDDVGREQARVAGLALGTVAELRTSPLGRARETASLLATGLTAIVDEAFVELSYGDAEGKTLRELGEAAWRELREDPWRRWPGGESLGDVQARVDPVLEALFARDGEGARRDDGDVVIVSHVAPIKAAVAWALRCDASISLRMRLDNATFTRIDTGPFGPVLCSYNEPPRPVGGDG